MHPSSPRSASPSEAARRAALDRRRRRPAADDLDQADRVDGIPGFDEAAGQGVILGLVRADAPDPELQRLTAQGLRLPIHGVDQQRGDDLIVEKVQDDGVIDGKRVAVQQVEIDAVAAERVDVTARVLDNDNISETVVVRGSLMFINKS